MSETNYLGARAWQMGRVLGIAALLLVATHAQASEEEAGAVEATEAAIEMAVQDASPQDAAVEAPVAAVQAPPTEPEVAPEELSPNLLLAQEIRSEFRNTNIMIGLGALLMGAGALGLWDYFSNRDELNELKELCAVECEQLTHKEYTQLDRRLTQSIYLGYIGGIAGTSLFVGASVGRIMQAVRVRRLESEVSWEIAPTLAFDQVGGQMRLSW